MRPARSIHRAALLLGAAVLAGCSYTVDVRNTTTRPVFVQMLQVDPIQPDWVLATTRIAPGEYATLGPAKVPFQRVVVDAGDQSARSTTARRRIRPGTTRLDVGSRPSPEPDRHDIVYTLETRED